MDYRLSRNKTLNLFYASEAIMATRTDKINWFKVGGELHNTAVYAMTKSVGKRVSNYKGKTCFIKGLQDLSSIHWMSASDTAKIVLRGGFVYVLGDHDERGGDYFLRKDFRIIGNINHLSLETKFVLGIL